MTALETTESPSAVVTLSDLDEGARNLRFQRLQDRMSAVWDSMKRDRDDESVVVIPSVSLNRSAPGTGSMMQAMEERSLFLLLLLRQPRLRMIYVTSMPIDPRVIEYYLALLPGVIPSHALARLTTLSVGDSSDRPLSEKLLERPRMLSKIARLIPDRACSHLIYYNTTARERDIALSLGIPMYGADPRLADLGTKTGCRRLFGEVGVRFPLGVEDLHTVDDVADAIDGILTARPTVGQVIVKLNDGVSGAGNAVVDLDGVTAVPQPARRAAIRDRVQQMQLESPDLSFDAYVAKLESDGGIVEERIVGEELVSPSVQLRIRPDGVVELLSTHDQLLGGASGQRYLGCTFPADQAYSRLISGPAMAIGERLSTEGVLGRFAVDFVVVRDAAGEWTEYAIELNLRKGGTTHPFLTLQFLTDGRYDGRSGLFLTPEGSVKHLAATDHLEADELRAISIGDLFDVVARHGLHFDQSRQVGIVFHMISSITEHGRVGMTAVGDTPEQAVRLYDRARELLLAEARAAGQERALPD
ncbi:peptide ligase PGM1-related protein [Micromonospora sp. DT81.3]|uniref:peptide ligase PGM1-related protein n=1 Tax=Micromonospora sp. DT81.3 TaxID=3416523 RepID=UPI003CF671D7